MAFHCCFSFTCIKIIDALLDFVVLSSLYNIFVDFPFCWYRAQIESIDNVGIIHNAHIREFLYIIHWHKQKDCPRCCFRIISNRTYRLIPNCLCIFICTHTRVDLVFSFNCRHLSFRYSIYRLSFIRLSLLFIIDRFRISITISSNQRSHENDLGEHIYTIHSQGEVFSFDNYFTCLVKNDAWWNLSTTLIKIYSLIFQL